MPAEHPQTAIAYLYYENGPEAIDFLCRAFGCEERQRQIRPDGTLGHSEVTLGGDVIMLATPQAGADGLADNRHDSSMFCYIDDVERHYAKAREAGARIVSEPADQGYGTVYCAEDSESRRWYFCSAQARA